MKATSPRHMVGVLLCGLLVLGVVALVCASVCLGVQRTSPGLVWQALTEFDPDNPLHVVVVQMRSPRVLLALLVGAAFAVAGVLMQAMTQNPLASPSLMGVNAGGTLALVLGIALLPGLTLTGAIALSFVGAAGGALLVYGLLLVSPRGFTPVHMALSGLVVSILLSAVTQGMIQQLQLASDMLFWTVGGLSNVQWSQLWPVAPPILAGLAGATALAPQWTVFSLGDDAAIGLGANTRRLRLAGSLIVLLLAGAAIAAAGPVMLVGLMAPHISRALVGTDCRKVIPTAAMTGAALVIVSDTLCRVLTFDRLPLGAFTALTGGLVFIVLARRGERLGRGMASA